MSYVIIDSVHVKVFWVVTPFSVVTSLHLEDGSSMILRNVDILAHHYTALHPKRLRT